MNPILTLYVSLDEVRAASAALAKLGCKLRPAPSGGMRVLGPESVTREGVFGAVRRACPMRAWPVNGMGLVPGHDWSRPYVVALPRDCDSGELHGCYLNDRFATREEAQAVANRWTAAHGHEERWHRWRVS